MEGRGGGDVEVEAMGGSSKEAGEERRKGRPSASKQGRFATRTWRRTYPCCWYAYRAEKEETEKAGGRMLSVWKESLASIRAHLSPSLPPDHDTESARFTSTSPSVPLFSTKIILSDTPSRLSQRFPPPPMASSLNSTTEKLQRYSTFVETILEPSLASLHMTQAILSKELAE